MMHGIPYDILDDVLRELDFIRDDLILYAIGCSERRGSTVVSSNDLQNAFRYALTRALKKVRV